MCSSQRPENGADSEPVERDFVAEAETPEEYREGAGMVELPRANRSMILQYLKDALPGATPQELEQEASKVEMADALGRAIHAAKRIGGPWPAPCVRIKPDTNQSEGPGIGPEDFEQVPYGYDDGTYNCECEAMALHLVELMAAQATMEGVKQSSQIVVARPN